MVSVPKPLAKQCNPDSVGTPPTLDNLQPAHSHWEKMLLKMW